MRCRRSVLAVSLVAVAVMTGCGGSSGESASPAAAAGAAAVDASFNDADTSFAHGMIEHHQQAIEMSDMALDPGSGASAAVVDLATRTKANQQPEIDLINGWLDAWDESHEGMDMDMEGMDHDMGNMSAEEMTALDAATGPAFDTMWLTLMIEHHRGAVSEALVVQRDGKNTDVRELATNVVTAQNADIAEMTALLG
jgi:uncharacterized protein (DUF305 family)